MKRISLDSEFVKDFKKRNKSRLYNIIIEITKSLKDKRKVMYSDIINYLNRNGFSDNDYNDILLWCNFKIRLGKIFVDFDKLKNEK